MSINISIVIVHAPLIYMYVCLLSVAWQCKFQRPISPSVGGRGDEVARVVRSATDYITVLRPWESSIRLMLLSHGLTTPYILVSIKYYAFLLDHIVMLVYSCGHR